MQYLSFSVWILSLNILCSRFTHSVACISSSLLFMAGWQSIAHMCHDFLSIQLSMNTWVASPLWLLWMLLWQLGTPTVKTSVSVSSATSLETYPASEFLDHVVILCLIFLRNHHTISHSVCIIWQSHQQRTEIQFLRFSPTVVIFYCFLKIPTLRNSLAVQGLELWASIAEGTGSLSGGGTRILQAV